jgi:hypothetical protein
MQISLKYKKKPSSRRERAAEADEGGRLRPEIAAVGRSGPGGGRSRPGLAPMRGGLAAVPRGAALQRAEEAGGGAERGGLAWGVPDSVWRQRVEGRCLDGRRRSSGAGRWGGRRSDMGGGGSGAEGSGDGFISNFLRSIERRNGRTGGETGTQDNMYIHRLEPVCLSINQRTYMAVYLLVNQRTYRSIFIYFK